MLMSGDKESTDVQQMFETLINHIQEENGKDCGIIPGHHFWVIRH
jgi:hypothetical protein